MSKNWQNIDKNVLDLANLNTIENVQKQAKYQPKRQKSSKYQPKCRKTQTRRKIVENKNVEKA